MIDNRFEIEGRAGEGGMGVVYRARDVVTGARAAVKMPSDPSPETLDRFVREARAIAKLNHPRIVRYLAHGEEKLGSPYLAMEWLEGQDLAARLERGPLTVPEALSLAAAVADGLAAAHTVGVVHRDLKPSNLFLPDDDLERVTIIDFGVAHVAQAMLAPTYSGAAVGTPAYMAPEQARGEPEIDARADMYSLGCVLFECLTGRPPFVAGHPIAVLTKALFEEPQAPSGLRREIPADVDRVVARLLRKDPRARPEDAAALGSELRALAASISGEPLSACASVPPSLTVGERRLASVVLATCALRSRASPEDETLSAATPVAADGMDVLALLRQIAEQHRARLESLRGESVAAVLVGEGSASDLAARAARCAIAIRSLLPEARLALATGWDVVFGTQPLGEVIDRAAALLEAGPTNANANGGIHADAPTAIEVRCIRLDPMTTELLGGRFEVASVAGLSTLTCERDAPDEARRLLGRPTTCVGRDSEFATLRGLFDECAEGRVARAAIVTGPAGIGKSRLKQELLRAIQGSHASIEVWTGRGDPMSAGAPLGLLVQALRRAAGLRSSDTPSERALRLERRIARHAPAESRARLTEFLGELLAAPTLGEPSLELLAARANPVLMGDQMRRAWEDFVSAETGARPVVLVLEDAHWGDLATLGFVGSALRRLHDRPLFVLALARPEIHDLFPRLWHDSGALVIALGGLTRRACERLAREALGDQVSPERISQLAERAEGNVFFLEELIRAEAQGRTDLPETVLAMVQARIAELPASARRLLRAASIFGESFPDAGVAELLGDQGAAGLPGDLDDLVSREVILKKSSPGEARSGEYVFRHGLVRDAAYAMLTEGDRVLGHRLTGDWLERSGSADPLSLAEHFERGGQSGRASPWYGRAAEIALTGNDLDNAVARAERGVSCGADGENLAALRLLQATAHNWRGTFEDGERCAIEALKLARPGSTSWYDAAERLLWSSDRLYRTAQVESLARTMRSVKPDPDAAGAELIAWAAVAEKFFIFGKNDRAESLMPFIDELELRLPAPEPAVTARVHALRSFRAYFNGDRAMCIRWTKPTIASYRRAGDLRNVCMWLHVQAQAYLDLGAFALARDALREGLNEADRLGLRDVGANQRSTLGIVLARLGEREDAEAMLLAAIETFEALRERRMQGNALTYLAMTYLLHGDASGAEREANRAIAVLESYPVTRIYPLTLLALAELRQGRTSEARATVQRLMSFIEGLGLSFDSLGDGAEAEFLIRLAHGEVLHASGERDAAAKAIGAARDRLLARASAINEPEWRDSFLRAVTENARTLELAREWLS